MRLDEAQLKRLLAPKKAITRTRLSGGDTSDVWVLHLDTRETWVSKSGPFCREEARMLTKLQRSGASTPNVEGVDSHMLLLSYIEGGAPTDESWQVLGRMLRHLHAHPQKALYGWDHDYTIGNIGLPACQHDHWPSYWVQEKIQPHLPFLPKAVADGLEEIVKQAAHILPSHPKPSLLHGDLWEGNIIFAPNGPASLIDPVCMIGDAHAEFAILTFFSTPPEGFWRVYGIDSAALQPQLGIYQLWPALMQYRLFGDGYLGLVKNLIDRTLKFG